MYAKRVTAIFAKNKSRMKKLMMMCMTAFLVGCNTIDMEERVNELYNKMSQEERIAQLCSGYMNEFSDKNGLLDTAH